MLNFFKKLKEIKTIDILENASYHTYFSKIDKVESEKILKRVFNSEEGKKALAYLQFITLQKSNTYTAPTAQLYFMEGQRALIINLLRIINTK